MKIKAKIIAGLIIFNLKIAMKNLYLTFALVLTVLMISNCSTGNRTSFNISGSECSTPFLWENANVYFLLTDRFKNGDSSNDINFQRTKETALLRGFMGGDIKGVTQKIEEGYFDDLGITALWITPFFEQVHGGVDEGTGYTYAFHGYWTSDWTAMDPNFGTEEELAEFVATAHEHGIRVLMDVIINHTGPVTEKDVVWPSDWVRTSPLCTYQGYESTVTCTLVDNLPDIKTESYGDVDLPIHIIDKWKEEGRYDKEMNELNEFFDRTGYPRAPRYYIIKWLVDYVEKYGIDGYRLDTGKHVEESVWAELGSEARRAFQIWKRTNPGQVLDETDFFMVGEVYNYGVSGGREFDFGDKKVDYFDYGMDGLINFDFKSDAKKSFTELFALYDSVMHNELSGLTILNYLSSHDDGSPFDSRRMKPLEAGTKLLLTAGASQIYYGDETGRSLVIKGTNGDATLRSFMNWAELEGNVEINGVPAVEILEHWQKLGRFRKAHLSVGAGKNILISNEPKLYSRVYKSESFSDEIVFGLDLDPGRKSLEVGSIFSNGTRLKDYYSGQKLKVRKGRAILNSEYGIVLLGKI